MQSKEIKLLEEFETEMWLYIEESLSEDRMKFWEEQLNIFPKLKEMLDDSLHAISIYEESVEYDLSESKYNEMIEKAAVKQNNLVNIFQDKLNNLLLPFLTRSRLAFGAAVIVAITLLIFIIEKPNKVNLSVDASLDWRGSKITNKLDEIDNSMNAIKSENTAEYQMYRFTKDKFDVAIQSIGDRINKLKNNMKSESL